jgi:hypothetical protein
MVSKWCSLYNSSVRIADVMQYKIIYLIWRDIGGRNCVLFCGSYLAFFEKRKKKNQNIYNIYQSSQFSCHLLMKVIHITIELNVPC